MSKNKSANLFVNDLLTEQFIPKIVQVRQVLKGAKNSPGPYARTIFVLE
jgi:hypothetical protein